MYPLKKGFYDNYKEFLNNTPSIQRNFNLIQRGKSLPDSNGLEICTVDFKILEGEDKVGHVWGFCDGNAVYIKLNRLENFYWKLQYLGQFSYFLHVVKPVVTSLTAAVIQAFVGAREFAVIDTDGRMVPINLGFLRRIFKRCPGLLEDYELEPNKRNEKVQIKYLRRLNEYLAANK